MPASMSPNTKAALVDGSSVYIINHFPLKVVAEKSQLLPASDIVTL
jgi:hypothetical protein